MTRATPLSARLVIAAALLTTGLSPALARAQESQIAAEFRREGEHLRHDCGAFNRAMSCGMTVATGHPVHLAIGSIAPGNGLALGGAFSTSHSPGENWRLSWSSDAVRSFGGAWRAGAYLTLVHTPSPVITLVTASDAQTDADALAVRPRLVIRLYGQSTSLTDLDYFGLGPSSTLADRTVFAMRHSVVGGGVVAPLSGTPLTRRLNLSLAGDAKVRFVTVRDGASGDAPGITAVYDAATAPGLADHPTFLEIGGGVRVSPAFGRYVRLNYQVDGHQWVAGNSRYSFRRWRVQLDHEFVLYGTTGPPDTRDTNTPNTCLPAPGAERCAGVSRDRRGAIHLDALVVSSSTGADAVVPFYLQPTLGGSDINGIAALGSFDDYRFRGPHLLLFRQSFEHSVWGPIGGWVQTDQGKVALSRAALGVGGLRKTIAAGLSIRAGGFPLVVLSYAVGGGEGRHVALTVNTSLLGGSSRPSLD